MTINLSPSLTGSISEIINTALSYDRKHNQELANQKIYDELDKLLFATNEEAESLLKNEDFEEAAKIYYLSSRTLTESASLINNTNISTLLTSSAASYLHHVDSILYNGISSYYNKARTKTNKDKESNYEEYTEYKNKAKALEYEMKTGDIYSRLDKEVLNFLKSVIKSKHDKYSSSNKSNFRNFLKSMVKPDEYSISKELEKFSKILTERDRTIKSSSNITPEQIDVKNDYEQTSKQGWFNWSIYLVPKNNDIINNIASVKYTLHPTFPNPEITIKDPTDGFKITGTGWGEFEIKADIYLDNGDLITKYHWLDLGLNEKI